MDYKQTTMWKEINQTPEIFSNIQAENGGVMKELVSEIKKSKITNFVAAARGTSDHALIYFKYVLEVLSDYTVGLSAPSVITLYKGKVNYKNSIVLGVSASGKAEDVLEVIKRANEQGSITVAITNDRESPMAKEAKFHLYCNAGALESVVATKSFNAEMYLLLWLASELSNNKDALFTLKNLKSYLELAMPEIDTLTSKYVSQFKDMENGFVLSRGFSYAIALEATMELQETALIQMKGFSSSEFYHGPMALVSEKTPILIYCAKNNCDEEMQSTIRADQIKNIEKMLALKAPVLLITNDIVLTGKFKKCKEALINLDVSEETVVFAFAIFAQMFACKLSCLKGYNPDNPRGIEGTVITR